MALVIPAAITFLLAFIFWMIACMLTCAACGLALRLCVGGLRKDMEFEKHFPGFALRAGREGVAALAAGLVSAIVFTLLVFCFTKADSMLFGEIAVWVCTALCILCGIQMIRLAKKLRQAAYGSSKYKVRHVACVICGVLALLSALPCVLLSVSLV